MIILKSEVAQAMLNHLELIDYHLDALRAPLTEARRDSATSSETTLSHADVTRHLAPSVVGQALRDTVSLVARFHDLQQQISDIAHVVEVVRRETLQEVTP